jgi:hypothetical protein
MSRYNLTDRQLSAAISLTLALAVAGAIGTYKFRDVAPYNKEYFDATFQAVRGVPHVVAPAWLNSTFGTLDLVSPSRDFVEAPVVAAGQ